MLLMSAPNTVQLGITSEWAGDEQLVIRSRKTKDGSKILIDVTEATHTELASNSVATRVARRSARRFGAASMDYSRLFPLMFNKKVYHGDGSQSVVKIRRTTFVFAGVSDQVVIPQH